MTAHKTALFLIIGLVIVLTAAAGFIAGAARAESEYSLKIALLPILDAFPYYVAREKGYFDLEKVKVDSVPVASAVDRDQLMQAAQVDGMLSEMTAAAVFNRTSIQVKIVGVLREAHPRSPLFRILAAPGSGINSAADLAGIPIGVSKNTIIEYVTDRLLVEKGLSKDKIIMKSIPVIPERYQLLMHGQIKAATLPDPMAVSAMKAGAKEIINDAEYPRYAISVFVFNLKAITGKPEAIRRFLRAWDRAVADIKSEPAGLTPLLFKTIRVPKNVQPGYIMPYYPFSKVPDQAQWDDVMAWMVEKGLIETPRPYDSTVTTSFLPKK